jgi:hypothetical protein
MKFIKALIILLVVCTKLELTHSSVKIWAFGDVGQIDPWWKESLIHKKAAAMVKKNKDFEPKAFELAKEISDSIKAESLSDTRPTSELFLNFHRIFKCPSSINSSVILGDGVYTEHKGGYIENKFGVENKDADINSKGTNKGVVIPPDESRKILMKTTATAKEDLSVKYGKRLEYASKKLLNLMNNPTCPSPPQNHIVHILPGNHNYDVNPELERETVNTWSTRRQWIDPKWKDDMTDGVTPPVVVSFLDINLMALTCIRDSEYGDCIRSQAGKGYASLPDQASGKLYLKALVARLAESRHKKINSTWRVVRTHNPLLNPEADFEIGLAFKIPEYECSLNNQIFTMKQLFEEEERIINTTKNFDCNVKLTNNKPTDSKYTLLDLFKFSKIHFWLTSHYHAAMFIASPFNRRLAPAGFNKDFMNGDNPKKCVDRFSQFFAPKPSGAAPPSSESPEARLAAVTLQTMADCPTSAVTRENLIEIENNKPQSLLLQFVIGNSGRMLDPIKSDINSNGDLVWARAYGEKYIDNELDKEIAGLTLDNFKDHVKTDVNNLVTSYGNKFGFAEVTFEANHVTIEFKEESAANLITVQKFKLTKSETPKKYAINYMLNADRSAHKKKLKKKLK